MNFTVCVRIRPFRIHTLFHSRVFFFIFVLFFVFVEGVVMFLYIPSPLELPFRDRSFVTQGQSVCRSQHEVKKKKHKHKTKIKVYCNSCTYQRLWYHSAFSFLFHSLVDRITSQWSLLDTQQKKGKRGERGSKKKNKKKTRWKLMIENRESLLTEGK
jgi:hypothetical protein